MGISDFLATIATGFRRHYVSLARFSSQNRTAEWYRNHDNSTTAATAPRVDRYEPSTGKYDKSAAPLPESKPETRRTPAGLARRLDLPHGPEPRELKRVESHDREDNDSPTSPAVVKNPDGTYYQRRARLDYRLGLRFDLASFTRTVEKLADGDTSAVEELAAAGFGFHADFALKGKQVMETTADGDETADAKRSRLRVKERARYGSASVLRAQTRDFNMSAYRREALDIRRSLDVKYRDGHRRAVNKFAFRLKTDSGFSFGLARRFNVQTKQIAEQQPEQVGRYLNNAGDIAIHGSSEMMASFFDAVDSYLNDTEQNVKDATLQAFDKAAQELGFEGALVEAARGQLSDSISGFFDRVETALSTIQQNYLPASEAQPADAQATTTPLPVDQVPTKQDFTGVAVA